MKKTRIAALFAAAALALAGALFTGCAEEARGFIEYSLSEELYVNGQRVTSHEYAEISADMGELIAETEVLFDAEAAGSDIARINAAKAGEAVTVDARTYAALSLCKQLYEETGGAFTPALYGLSELWGFTPAYEGRYSDPRPAPSAEAVAEALAHSDLSGVVLGEGNTVTKTDGETRLDLGGVAKGYMTDLAAALIKERYAGKTVEYSAEVMSNLILAGVKHDSGSVRGYNIGITDPRAAVTGAVQCLFFTGMRDVAVSTSSDAYRFYVYEGEIYPHILDPETGAPSQNGVISVTVAVPLSAAFAGARADAYSTAGFCMPLTEALAFYEDLYARYGVTAVVITQDFRYYTVGGGTVLNRKEYAASIEPPAEAQNVYTLADTGSARDDVPRCAEEEEYIAYIAGLSG